MQCPVCFHTGLRKLFDGLQRLFGRCFVSRVHLASFPGFVVDEYREGPAAGTYDLPCAGILTCPAENEVLCHMYAGPDIPPVIRGEPTCVGWSRRASITGLTQYLFGIHKTTEDATDADFRLRECRRPCTTATNLFYRLGAVAPSMVHGLDFVKCLFPGASRGVALFLKDPYQPNRRVVARQEKRTHILIWLFSSPPSVQAS